MMEKPAKSRKPKPKNPLIKLLKRQRAIVAPSLLSADFSQLKSELAKVKRTGLRWVHIDIMDGHFVPNITIGPPVVRSLSKNLKGLFFDTHLMIDNPEKLADAFKSAGSNHITIHFEVAHENTSRIINLVKNLGITVGISIKPKTPVLEIEKFLSKVNLVLVMTVEPGFGGQTLIPSTLTKVRDLELLKQKHKLDYIIEVDGGINTETAPLAVAAGAQVLVAGDAVFSGGRVSDNINALMKSIMTVK